MKIAHVIDYFQPELGYQETYLAKEQLKDGHEVKVFTSDRYFPFPNFDNTYSGKLGSRIKGSGEFLETGIPVLRLAIKRELFTRVWMKGLESALKDYGPDYILVHNIMTITAYKVSKINFGKSVKIVYDDHMSGLSQENFRHKMMRLYFNLKLKRAIEKSASAIVSVTKTGMKFLQEKYSFAEHKLSSIPLGFHESTFYSSDELRETSRKELGVSKNSFIIVYSGKINKGKGIIELISALKELHHKFEEVKFICIGSGDSSIEEAAQNVLGNIMIKFNFLKPEELCKYYNASDVGIWPDGITASHIEANACGLPIVVSNWPASVERVTEGNGTFLNECNPAEIVTVLSGLIEDRSRLLKMKDKAAIVSKAQTWSAINKKFLAL